MNNSIMNMGDLRICRICLIKDVRGFAMDRYNLKQCYEQIIRAKVNDREGLPKWFCYECATMLHKFNKFKEKCNKGQVTLRQMLWSKGISYESVSIINRFSEKLISPVGIMMFNKRNVKTCLVKHKPDPNKKVEEQEENVQESHKEKIAFESSFESSFENVTLTEFSQDDKVGIKKEDELLKNERKSIFNENLANDDFGNDLDMDNMGADNVMSSDDEVLLPIREKQTTEKPPEPNNAFNLENIMNTDNVSSDDDYFPPAKKNLSKNNENENVKTADPKIKPKKKKPVMENNGVKKDPKFLMRKKKLNPDHWKKINLSEEQAMMEFKTRETSDKFLKANYKCKECFKGFSRIDMLLRHAKRAHEESAGSFQCRFCQMRFPKKWGLTGHMPEHYIRFQCLRCDMHFRERSAIFHDDVHNGVTRKCEHCGKEFTHLSTYYTHLRMTHRSAHICTVCGASFVSDLGLQNHKKITHFDTNDNDAEEGMGPSSAANIYCEKCDIKFVTQTAYDEHLANSAMHGDAIANLKARDFREKKIPTICAHCGENFPTKGACRKHHLAEHRHIPLENREICEICGASISAGNIAKHMVTHTGERPYPCPVCEKRFTQKSSMKMHYKTVHLKMPYPKYPRRKDYRRKKKTEEIPQNDFSAFIRPGYYL